MYESRVLYRIVKPSVCTFYRFQNVQFDTDNKISSNNSVLKYITLLSEIININILIHTHTYTYWRGEGIFERQYNMAI